MSRGRGGARFAVRDDDARGGARTTSRPDAKSRGPKPDLAAAVSDLRTKLANHRYKFNTADLEQLREALGAALADVTPLQAPDEEWDGKEVL